MMHARQVTELKSAITKAINKVKTRDKIEEYSILMESMERRTFSHIIIPELGDRRILNLSNIIAIEADGAYSKIYLKENNFITISKNLKYFEAVIPIEAKFFRSHRTWIINLSLLHSINKTEQIVTLTGGIKAKISRGKIEGFEEIIS